ncbi:YggS family pyridoxal phosphate-dependent enzyme [Alicyclobacillus suci]|uniref:YggS family pyridoxal phosphate-dependent enzyme n=1 Tax=Alicyclobacillus suci TaxID=2816080 RepID=UPI001A8CB70F|nr:YggS family pyridoxal phosphate-dependent enzyme [Alicyclobacillus suci]
MDDSYILKNVEQVRTQVQRALSRRSRPADAVRIIAVTKSATSDVLPLLANAGIFDAAENRWQVARDKFEHPAAKRFEWHFIGSLQTNKVKYIVPRFNWVHSVDRLELARALSQEAVKQSRMLNVLLQVNIAREPQKHGFFAEDVKAVAGAVVALPNLVLRGFMAMAPKVNDMEETRPVFRAMDELLAKTRQTLGLPQLTELSMGMSEDYPVAVEEGATMIRVGRYLVGHPGGAKEE